MKLQKKISTLVLLLLCTYTVLAQTPGLIYKPAGNALGKSILDPNGDGFTSLTTAGFSGTDYGSNSELRMIPLPVLGGEPVGDLTSGGAGGFTDIASFASNQQSCYILKKNVGGTDYLIIRFRQGGNATSSKGFSFLMDINNTFGTWSGNNPGFEREVVLQTGSNGIVAVYEHTQSTTTLTQSFPIDNYCQRSIALSTNNSDKDYFLDFFIPFSALNVTTEPVRIAAVTLISAGSGITGTVSDFNGVDDRLYGNDRTAIAKALITAFPATPLSDLTDGYTYPAAVSQTPVVNAGINSGSTSISGTSSEADGTTINVYKNGTLIGTTTVSSNTWTLSGVSGLAAGDLITAKATASSKTESAASDAVTVTAAPICYTAVPTITSATNTGAAYLTITWSWPAGVTPVANSVQVIAYSLTANNGTTYTAINATPAQYMGVTGTMQYSLGSSGAVKGAYVAKVIYNGCTSGYSSTAIYGNSSDGLPTVAPSITTTPVYANVGSTSISVKNNDASTATLYIYVNGVLKGTSGTTIASAASTSFSITGLIDGDRLEARALGTTTNQMLSPLSTAVIVQASAVATTAPVITGAYIAGSGKTVTGTSTEAAGTVITLYAGTTLLGTTTVNAYGTWSVSSLTLSSTAPANALTAYAKATGKTLSAVSNTVTVAASQPAAPSISGSYVVGGTSVSGTAPVSGTITVYVDGSPVGTTTGTSWSLTGLAAGQLYKGAVITATNTVGGVTSPLSAAVTVTGVTSFLITNTLDASIGTQVAGVSFPIKIVAKDGAAGAGNTFTSFTGKVVLSSTSTITAGAGETIGFTAGVLTPQNMTLTTAGINKTITAVSVDDPTATGVATLALIAPNVQYHLVLNAPADIVAGQRAAYTVSRTDAYANAVTTGALTVYLSVNGTTGTFYDAAVAGNTITSVVIPDGQSSASFWYTATKADGYSVTASDALLPDGDVGLHDDTDAINVTAGVASKYIITLSTAAVFSTTIPVTAQLVDEYDNPVSTAGQTVTWSSTNGGSFSAATSVTDANGLATIDLTVASLIGTTHAVSGTTSSITGTANVLVIAAAVAPTVVTNDVRKVQSIAAILGGNITADGGAVATAKGIVYSTSDNTPVLGEPGVTTVSMGSGNAAFQQSVTGLTLGQLYYYRAYATNIAGTAYGDVKSFSAACNGSEEGQLAIHEDESTITVQIDSNYLATSVNCRTLALVRPSGAQPVSGLIDGKVWVGNTAGSYGGVPYAPRTYQITPRSNAASATAVVTLYYTQDDFDKYNLTYNGSDLPYNAADAEELKDNIRIYKYSGTSSDGSGHPSTYSQPGIQITPTAVVWNATMSRWEVTFNTSGFSGFFLGNDQFLLLPVTLSQFTGKATTHGNVLTWVTASEVNAKEMQLERSKDGIQFETVAIIKAKGQASTYTYTDAVAKGVNFYRLKMLDKDASKTYSQLVKLQAATTAAALELYPNPSSAKLSLQTSLQAGVVEIHNLQGTLLLRQTWKQGESIDVSKLPAGNYRLTLTGSSVQLQTRMMKL